MGVPVYSCTEGVVVGGFNADLNGPWILFVTEGGRKVCPQGTCNAVNSMPFVRNPGDLFEHRPDQ